MGTLSVAAGSRPTTIDCDDDGENSAAVPSITSVRPATMLKSLPPDDHTLSLIHI